MRVYLAGPDVFLPNAEEWFAQLREVCTRHGLEAITPLDPFEDDPAWAQLPEPARIARRNEAHIRGAGAVIANLTPFRGVSADAGTVYEVGFARGLGRPVLGYTTVGTTYADRCPADGMEVEGFGLFDNLMIACAVDAVVEQRPERWRDLLLFERVVISAAALPRTLPNVHDCS